MSVLLLALPAVVHAALARDDAVPTIVLWDTAEDAPTRRITERSDDPALPDRIIEDVRAPYLAVYAPQRPNGTALLVTPGGGYARVVLDKEGTALVPAFVDAAGITLFVLRYRLPDRTHAEGADAPLADAQRAMRLIRAHASDYGIDPARVGVMGFSAGGHVAARLATTPDAVYAATDAADTQSFRPDFALLVYPVISMHAPVAHAGSRARVLTAGDTPEAIALDRYSPDLHVDSRTPPLFLLHAQDDDVVPVGNALAMHAAALRAGVPTSLHVFPHGGHGFGTRGATGALARWPQLAIDWIQEQTRHHD
ncbi:alpha/beta hydrolase [Luteimonas fraxinea]|uniref:Alpha/beta hydrolase n=1 Tax=Luteimonas fraxinea TaxID=2901869 RepID=A0ABS8UGD3_9GAMM|nr:alpha/beta hydrolase [Luteimonas fraxinea]MCD9098548.1 alpha/beta hydrolase [Luteimonas fraxinea]MCD9127281.1 alpha/beta hydrolase [Luteimonas fraxinea]UHH09048.1 alpha/beta hydrolase [Luteimonas fraxinea]